jgi:hypothetical protein
MEEKVERVNICLLFISLLSLFISKYIIVWVYHKVLERRSDTWGSSSRVSCSSQECKDAEEGCPVLNERGES